MAETTTTTTTAGHVHGYCACGRLRYTIDCTNLDSDLTLSAFCHCSRCQRINGAPFVHSLHLKYPAVTWDSKPEKQSDDPPRAPETGFSPQAETYESLPGKKWKLRCKTCGSPMGTWNGERLKWVSWLLPLLPLLLLLLCYQPLVLECSLTRLCLGQMDYLAKYDSAETNGKDVGQPGRGAL